MASRDFTEKLSLCRQGGGKGVCYMGMWESGVEGTRVFSGKFFGSAEDGHTVTYIWTGSLELPC